MRGDYLAFAVTADQILFRVRGNASMSIFSKDISKQIQFSIKKSLKYSMSDEWTDARTNKNEYAPPSQRFRSFRSWGHKMTDYRRIAFNQSIVLKVDGTDK